MTISKSITITGVDGAGIDTNGGNAISISTVNPADLTVHIDRLILRNVSGSPSGGISIGNQTASEGTLWVTHCNIQGYSGGIVLLRASLVAEDTVITQNDIRIWLLRASARLDHVLLSGNKTSGVQAGQAGLIVVDTTATGNGDGFTLNGAGASFARSTIEANRVGINFTYPPSPASAISFGDNHIKNNGTDVRGGTLTNVGTQ